MLQTFFEKIFGTNNDRELKKYRKILNAINQKEPYYEKLSDEELKSSFLELKKSVLNESKSLDDVLVDSFAITREASKRVLKMRHHDVQLIGGIVLHEGKIAEMKTGEGKTLVATLAIILNAMSAKGVHLVTVNDYLASRDGNEMRPLYEFLGFSVGVLLEHMRDPFEKKAAYEADITYGTNNEYGFDYLRDNMSYSKEHMVQRGHNFVIVDEVDSILIDEARTPLIISGPTKRTLQDFSDANSVALKLQKDKDFSVDEKDRIVLLSDEGITRAEELFKVENLYSPENASLSHLLDQALKANYLFEKDVHYVVNNNEVIIVDEFTGRLSEGRRFSEGLHQALEAKENVEIKEETQTLADVTFQNYFRMYKKLSGMTGTAQTEATEFMQIYGLDVVSIPTNKPIARVDLNDLVYKTEREKFEAVIIKIKELQAKGQPALIGTASIDKSEVLHELLVKHKIPHTVLNAKNHAQEGEIIKQAGAKGAITIATNMAGRGVDIKVSDEIKALGGLYIIGTERHENRRIDNQLRGRSGRQGDAGVSQFYLSLEDNLLRIFGSDKIKAIMERLGVKDGEYIDSKMVTRSVEKAQKKVENMHFEGRKHIVEYDDVANKQRQIIYAFRNQILDEDFDIASKIDEMRVIYVRTLLNEVGIYAGMAKEEFDLNRLKKAILEQTHRELDFSNASELEYEELSEMVINKLRETYKNKMSVLDEKIQADIEREISLKELDSSWREHLYAMDNMKTGIRLRAYNQKDPLVEYKKESFNLFNDLLLEIRSNIIKTLHSIEFKFQDPQEEAKKVAAQMEMERKIQEAAMIFNRELEENEQKNSASKITRNDMCPCGSGKKYKQCCGKSGPKKGIFAS